MAKLPKLTFKKIALILLVLLVSNVIYLVGRFIGGNVSSPAAQAQGPGECWWDNPGPPPVCESND